ncbi:MAG: hypothetical protein QW655_06985 [Nitrososphaerota archaeon]
MIEEEMFNVRWPKLRDEHVKREIESAVKRVAELGWIRYQQFLNRWFKC